MKYARRGFVKLDFKDQQAVVGSGMAGRQQSG
jgi:hypothetical protein